MRIRVPRRFLLLGILLCSLAIVATAVPQTTLAKPIPWDPTFGPLPGDGDGSVVKGTTTSAFVAPTTTVDPSNGVAPSITVRKARVTTPLSIWKAYLTALRLGYGWRWLW